MDSNALFIVLGSGLLSFLLGALLRRAWLKHRHRKAQDLLVQMQALARERQRHEPPSLNKSKRRRQQREQARDGARRG